jgi:hypothetical protein
MALDELTDCYRPSSAGRPGALLAQGLRGEPGPSSREDDQGGEVSHTPPDEVMASWAAAWSEPEAEERRRLIDRAWGPEPIAYAHPPHAAAGRDEILAVIQDFQRRRPGHRIVTTGPVEVVHGWLRTTWAVLGPDGGTVLQGVTVAELAADGRMRRAVDFWGLLPPGSEARLDD